MTKKIDNMDLIKECLTDAIEIIGWEQAARTGGMALLPAGLEISPEQGRMARANLKMTCREAGDQARLAGPTISRFETNYSVSYAINLSIRQAYERMGIVFYANGAVGSK
jgi:hypothetical protein